jgi:MFS family permease
MRFDALGRMASRFPFRLFTFVFLGWTFDFYDLVLLGFLKEDVGRSLGLTPSAEAWLLGVALGTSGVGGIVAGLLADRVGKRHVLAGTVLVYSLGSLAAGLAPSWPWFLFARAVTGLGIGGEWALGHGLLAEAVDPAIRGRAAAALQAGEPAGVAIAAVVGYLVLPQIGWRWVLIGSSATALLAAAMRWTRHLPAEARQAAVPWRTLLRGNVGTRFARAWILGVLKLGTYWTCYTWLPGFLLKQMHQGVGRSVTWMLTAQLGQLAGMASFGVVSDRVGRRPAFCVYSLLSAAALGPLAYFWTELSARPPLFWLTMLLLGIGSGCTAGFGALLAELFPSPIRTTGMGATYNLARSAQLMAPVVVGWAVAANGIAGGLTVPLLLALATAAWVWTLPETRGIALPRG